MTVVFGGCEERTCVSKENTRRMEGSRKNVLSRWIDGKSRNDPMGSIV